MQRHRGREIGIKPGCLFLVVCIGVALLLSCGGGGGGSGATQPETEDGSPPNYSGTWYVAIGHSPRFEMDGVKLISFFEAMSDAVFDQYWSRGVPSRQATIIPKAERDADPLTCDGETFLDNGSLENYIDLTDI